MLCGCSFLIFSSQKELSFLLRTISILLGVAVTVATVFVPKIAVVCARKKSRADRERYRDNDPASSTGGTNEHPLHNRYPAEARATDSGGPASRPGTRTGTREGLMDSLLVAPASHAASEFTQLQLEVTYLRGVVEELSGRLAAYEPSASADSSSRASVLQQPSAASMYSTSAGPAQSERGSALRKDNFFSESVAVAASQDSVEDSSE